jgi:NAD/NADP transhydrogenase alpha subunit
MKEATGELNMTLVVIIAVAAIMAFAMWFVPKIIQSANATWESSINNTINNR